MTESKEYIEELFGKVALERQIVSEKELEESLAKRQDMMSGGKFVRLGEVMMLSGLITKAQALELLKAAHKKAGDHKRIGGYELMDKLGEGAMGAVYRARQISMDRDVALKLLPQSVSENGDALDRFLREAKIVARLNHPNIVRGYEVGEGNGYHYFAMEFVDGGTVGDRFKKHGRLKEAEVIDIAIQALEGLAHAHEAGVVHRDIKPDNIMYGSSGVVKLADLGLAKSSGGDTLTATGDTVGTPYYMSPEQVLGGKEIDGRSDIYSLGATLFHLVTGEPPFTGKSVPSIMSKRLMEKPPMAFEKFDNVSKKLSSVIMKMMTKEKEQRYENCEEIIQELKRIVSGRNPLAMKLLVAEKPRAKTLAGALDATPLPSKSDIVSEEERAQEKMVSLTPLPENPELLPEWLTFNRAIVITLVLVSLAALTWAWRNWGRIQGPVHPTDSSIDWRTPPQQYAGDGEEIFAEWEYVRKVISDPKAKRESKLRMLRSFVSKYPNSALGKFASNILADIK